MSDLPAAKMTTEDLMIQGDHLQKMLNFCGAMVQSGMLPKQINNPQKALVVMLKTRELGMSPMYAFSNMYVIGGKAEISAAGMEGLVRKHGVNVQIQSWDDEGCSLIFVRDDEEHGPFSFGKKDAQRAGLLSNDMYRSRCRRACRCPKGRWSVDGPLRLPSNASASTWRMRIWGPRACILLTSYSSQR